MTDAKTLRRSINTLLAERARLKARNTEIARKLHFLRVKLARLPDAGDDPAPDTSQGNTIAPRDALDDFLDNL